jgi:hypothetical protein
MRTFKCSFSKGGRDDGPCRANASLETKHNNPIICSSLKGRGGVKDYGERGMSINNKNEVYGYWNSRKNKQLQAGQNGDSFLSDNESYENVPVPQVPYVPKEKPKSTGNLL